MKKIFETERTIEEERRRTKLVKQKKKKRSRTVNEIINHRLRAGTKGMAVKKQTRNNDRLSLSNNSSLEKSLERIVHKSQQHRCYREMQMIRCFELFHRLHLMLQRIIQMLK